MWAERKNILVLYRVITKHCSIYSKNTGKRVPWASGMFVEIIENICVSGGYLIPGVTMEILEGGQRNKRG